MAYRPTLEYSGVAVEDQFHPRQYRRLIADQDSPTPPTGLTWFSCTAGTTIPAAVVPNTVPGEEGNAGKYISCVLAPDWPFGVQVGDVVTVIVTVAGTKYTFKGEVQMVDAPNSILEISGVPETIIGCGYVYPTGAEAAPEITLHYYFNSASFYGRKAPQTDNADDVWIGSTDDANDQPQLLVPGGTRSVNYRDGLKDDLANWYLETTVDADGVVVELYM